MKCQGYKDSHYFDRPQQRSERMNALDRLLKLMPRLAWKKNGRVDRQVDAKEHADRYQTGQGMKSTDQEIMLVAETE